MPRPSRPLGRTLSMTAAAGAAAAALFLSPASAAAAEPTPAQSAQSAAAWLANNATLAGPGFVADYVFAYVSSDAASGKTAAALSYLDDAAVLAPYVGNATDGYKSAQVAKILLAVEAGGGDGNDVGGIDLEAALRGLEGSDGVFTGGFASPLGQSLAVLALSRTGDGVSAKAVDALEAAQCDNGGYGWDFAGGACDGDVDATGIVASALIAAKSPAAAKTLDWLESQQQADGAFLAGFPGAPENANSTGVAGQALAAGGRTASAAKAREFLLGLQIGCEGKETDRGAIPYSSAGLDDQAVYATSQAVLALTGEGLDSLTSKDDTAVLPTVDCTTPPTGSPSPSASTSASATPTGGATDTKTTTPPAPAANAGNTKGKLPLTGSSLGLPLAGGAALVAVGAALVLFVRRRRQEQS